MFQRLLHNHFVWVSSSDLRHEVILVLDAKDLLVVHNDLFLEEFHLNRPEAVRSPSSIKDLLNEFVVTPVLLGLIFVFQIGVVAAS